MATLTKIKYTNQADHLPSRMKAVINYCLNPEKTKPEENAHAVSGQNCTPKFAYREFMANKAVWNKEKGLCFRHYVQSFHPDEKITPDQANEIGLEFAKRAWPGYGVLVATHSDRDHIHNHFVIDTVHTETGKKLHENKQNMQRLRKINDEVCAEHRLSVLTPYENGQTKSISSREYRSGVKRESWKFRLRASIKYAMECSGTQEEFILRMKNMGYGVRWERGRKNITYTCFKEPKYKNGAYRKCNDDKLSDEKYLKEVMEDEFRQRQEILAGRDDGHVRTKRRRNTKRDTHGLVDGRRMELPDSDAGANASADGRDGNAKPQVLFENGNGVEAGREIGQRTQPGDARTHQESTRADGQSLSANASGVRKTGWETERGIYFSGAANGQTRKGNVLDKPNLPSVPSRSGVLLAGTAGLISTMGTGNDGKTPEEREAEERARETSGNLAAAIALTAVGISLALKKAHTEEENLENEHETEPDNEQEMKL